MTTHRIAAEATMAWDAGHRRRRATAGLERCIDGVMAGGGMLVVNAVASLNLGLPEGRAGLSLGGALLAAGAAHLAHRRRATRPAAPTYAPAPQLRVARTSHRAA